MLTWCFLRDSLPTSHFHLCPSPCHCATQQMTDFFLPPSTSIPRLMPLGLNGGANAATTTSSQSKGPRKNSKAWREQQEREKAANKARLRGFFPQVCCSQFVGGAHLLLKSEGTTFDWCWPPLLFMVLWLVC